MSATVVVIAKAPVPGQVKTRLCPPLTADEAAAVAGAALHDTLEAVRAVPGVRRVLALSGPPERVSGAEGFHRIEQRGEGLAERLHHAFLDAGPGPTVLVGMDTPHLGGDRIAAAVDLLHDARAVLGPATDGGWWLLGLRRPADAGRLRGVPMSTARTGPDTVRALAAVGADPVLLETMTDVDTYTDALAVASTVPASRFARALALVGVAS